MSVHTVVTAAGSSSRMSGTDKLLLPLQGVPLLVRTLEPFLSYPSAGTLVVAVNPERCEEFEELFRLHFPTTSEKKLLVTAGGAHRQESISLALDKLSQFAAPNDVVMIHDGARPFVSHELFDKLIEELKNYDGVIPALPVRDTIKRVDGSKVLHTEDRETLRMVQTPQVFPFRLAHELHLKAKSEGFLGTDDASLLERYDRSVGWVEGPIHNLKVTVPEDIALLNHLDTLALGKSAL